MASAFLGDTYVAMEIFDCDSFVSHLSFRDPALSLVLDSTVMQTRKPGFCSSLFF